MDETTGFTPKPLLDLHQRLVREQGLCGELAPDGSRICILAPQHDELHPWDASLLDTHVDKLVERVKLTMTTTTHGPICQCTLCVGLYALTELAELARKSTAFVPQ